jgi:hypothetical protein
VKQGKLSEERVHNERLCSEVEEEPATNGCDHYEKKLPSEGEEEEEPEETGCDLYGSSLESHANLCAMFPGRLLQIGLLFRLLTGVRQ